MIFNFNTFNHNPIGVRSIEDVINIIGSQLADLGHTVLAHPDRMYKDGAINILFENFGEEAQIVLEDSKRQGVRFIIVATERPAPQGFLGWDETFNQGRRMWSFPAAAALADAVWCLIPDSIAWFQAHHANCTPIELGHSPRLERPIGETNPEHDFAAFGLLTPHRRAAILALRQAHTVLCQRIEGHEGNFLKRELRDQMVRDARVSLHLKQSQTWNIISASRCATSLHLGRPVLSERVDCESPWHGIIMETDTLLNDAPMVSSGWRALHACQMAMFRETLSAQRCLGEAVRSVA